MHWNWEYKDSDGDTAYVAAERHPSKRMWKGCTVYHEEDLNIAEWSWVSPQTLEECLRSDPGRWEAAPPDLASQLSQDLGNTETNNTEEDKDMQSNSTNPLAALLSDLQQGAMDGAKQAATDAAGDALLEVATKLLGKEHTKFLETELGKAAAKVVLASVVLVAVDTLLPSQKDKAQDVARLQVQTATLDLLRPHLGTLRQLAQTFAGM